ncbi:MAG: DUF58 domain-containing protein [Gemmataceae bacterium]|nr:DUF58 domain-containing protein [Gemmataceae bacterium]MDW8267088.1 DUF58 domain-containing protein [Gemmataceae bacterium]
MIPPEIRRQIRHLHLRARHAVQDLLGGEYHSVFRGTGLAFEEVREYQPGDDVRSIDWNVTARMGHPYIKRYVEERELTVILLVDHSGSLQFGTQRQSKRAVAGELAALIAFAAIANNDKVGLICCSDRVERFVPPRKGTRHALRLIRDVLCFQAEHRGTRLAEGLDYLNRVIHRRAIVFLLSDFLDQGYEAALRRTGRRHDLIAIRIIDPWEMSLPAVGLLEVEDAETGQRRLIDTALTSLRHAYAAAAQARGDALRRVARSCRIDLIEVTTDGGHLDALVEFFRLRERRLRRT